MQLSDFFIIKKNISKLKMKRIFPKHSKGKINTVKKKTIKNNKKFLNR